MTQLLETQFIGRNVLCFESIDSTNDFLKNMARQLPNGTVVIAEEQLSGRGSRGNKWVSTKGQMVEFSFMLFNNSFTKLPPVTLICALAVVRALNMLCGGDFFIKWPNDIVCDGKKVCGILCESKIEKSCCTTVCGIGINISQDADFFVHSGIPDGASIKMLKVNAPSHEQLIAAILNFFEQIFTALEHGSERETATFFSDYSELCVTLGKQIRAHIHGSEIVGTAKAVNTDGTLSIMCEGKNISLVSGEVSVRGIMGYI